jgi:hypothetical protein
MEMRGCMQRGALAAEARMWQDVRQDVRQNVRQLLVRAESGVGPAGRVLAAALGANTAPSDNLRMTGGESNLGLAEKSRRPRARAPMAKHGVLGCCFGFPTYTK